MLLQIASAAADNRQGGRRVPRVRGSAPGSAGSAPLRRRDRRCSTGIGWRRDPSRRPTRGPAGSPPRAAPPSLFRATPPERRRRRRSPPRGRRSAQRLPRAAQSCRDRAASDATRLPPIPRPPSACRARDAKASERGKPASKLCPGRERRRNVRAPLHPARSAGRRSPAWRATAPHCQTRRAPNDTAAPPPPNRMRRAAPGSSRRSLCLGHRPRNLNHGSRTRLLHSISEG